MGRAASRRTARIVSNLMPTNAVSILFTTSTATLRGKQHLDKVGTPCFGRRQQPALGGRLGERGAGDPQQQTEHRGNADQGAGQDRIVVVPSAHQQHQQAGTTPRQPVDQGTRGEPGRDAMGVRSLSRPRYAALRLAAGYRGALGLQPGESCQDRPTML